MNLRACAHGTSALKADMHQLKYVWLKDVRPKDGWLKCVRHTETRLVRRLEWQC